MNWLSLITTLPTANATVRMRVWRTLKGAGAAVLRDGVYLLPERADCRTTLEAVASEVVTGGGSAHVLRLEEPAGGEFAALFERSADYAELQAEITRARDGLNRETLPEALKLARKLRKMLECIAAVDFFPGPPQATARAGLEALEAAAARLQSPDEPGADGSLPEPRNTADYRARTWATRSRPWADRLACTWLIRRFIDPDAHFLWLATPTDCPADAVGFDFDGAEFSHHGRLVTFEVLLASFGLAQAGLKRLAELVHFLDVGGPQPAEAAGIEQALLGLRDTLADDDRLLAAADIIFDGLFAAFDKGLRK
jgi:hypothetical protein